MQTGNFKFWKNRNFLALWSAQTISAMGDTFNFLALAIRVDNLFGDPADSARALSGVLIAAALPQLLLGLVAGTLVDRWDRKKVMIISDLARAVLIPLYLLVRTPADLPIAYAAAFMASVFSVMFYPARTALLPHLVSGEDLLSANGWMQIGSTMARLAGPALGGIVVGLLGTGAAFLFDSASFVVSGLLVVLIRGVASRVSSDKAMESPWIELKRGIAYTLQSRLLQGITLGLGIAMLGIGGVDVLLVPFLRSGFQAGPEALGGLMTMQGVGMVAGGLTVSWLGRTYKPVRIAFVSMLILGAGVMLIGFAPTFSVALGLILVIGLSLPPLNAALQTMLQVGVPNEMLGRAGSVVDVGLSIASISSMAAAGTVSGLIGIPRTYALSGVLMIAGGLLMGRLVGAAMPGSDQAELQPSPVD